MSRKNIKKGGCITLVLLFFCGTSRIASAELFNFNLPAEILEADMDICNASKCLTLKTSRISVSAVDRNYSFADATIELKNKDTQKSDFRVEAGEGYLDQKASILILKKLKSPYEKQELLINLNKLQASFSKR